MDSDRIRRGISGTSQRTEGALHVNRQQAGPSSNAGQGQAVGPLDSPTGEPLSGELKVPCPKRGSLWLPPSRKGRPTVLLREAECFQEGDWMPGSQKAAMSPVDDQQSSTLQWLSV